MTATAPERDYRALTVDVPQNAPQIERMRAVVEALWAAFQSRQEGDRGLSWVGFYLGPGLAHEGRTAKVDEMVLAVREPKPACSPIGLHGACGRCYTTGRPLVVTDVESLGEEYVACDPRDRSEIVVACHDERGQCYAVLDLDSFDVGAFGVEDAAALTRLLADAGLTAPGAGHEKPLVV